MSQETITKTTLKCLRLDTTQVAFLGIWSNFILYSLESCSASNSEQNHPVPCGSGSSSGSDYNKKVVFYGFGSGYTPYQKLTHQISGQARKQDLKPWPVRTRRRLVPGQNSPLYLPLPGHLSQGQSLPRQGYGQLGQAKVSQSQSGLPKIRFRYLGQGQSQSGPARVSLG